MTDQKLLMTASSRNDDEVVSFRDTSRRNDVEMAVSKGFPEGRAHSAHLLRYDSSMMDLRHVSLRQALHLDQMGTADPSFRVVRLLIYTFIGGGFPFERFAEFLKHAKKAGCNPYTVYMGWNPASDYRKVSSKGFNAVSAYEKGGAQRTFGDLVRSVEKDYWGNAARAKVPYVPLVTTGWEKNPRKDNPVSWEKGQSYHNQKVFPSRAKPEEIAAHLNKALEYVKKHQKMCPAQTVIIYAWNEYDEGGWIAPTRKGDGTPDTSRLDAIQKILKKNDKTEEVRTK